MPGTLASASYGIRLQTTGAWPRSGWRPSQPPQKPRSLPVFSPASPAPGASSVSNLLGQTRRRSPRSRTPARAGRGGGFEPLGARAEELPQLPQARARREGGPAAGRRPLPGRTGCTGCRRGRAPPLRRALVRSAGRGGEGRGGEEPPPPPLPPPPPGRGAGGSGAGPGRGGGDKRRGRAALDGGSRPPGRPPQPGMSPGAAAQRDRDQGGGAAAAER